MENFISPLRFKKSNYVIRLFSNYKLHKIKGRKRERKWQVGAKKKECNWKDKKKEKRL